MVHLLATDDRNGHRGGIGGGYYILLFLLYIYYYPFIHPSIHLLPLWVGFARGILRCFEVMRYLFPPASYGSILGSTLSGTCPEDLQREALKRHPNPNPKLTQLAPFYAKEQQLYSELPADVWAPRFISKAKLQYTPKVPRGAPQSGLSTSQQYPQQIRSSPPWWPPVFPSWVVGCS